MTEPRALRRPSPSVPGNTAEARELLQARLAMLGRIATLVTLGFGALGGLAMTVARTGDGAWQWTASALHVSASLVYGAVWVITRRKAPLPSALLL